MQPTDRSRTGLTLVELLVVIAVIGILAALLLSGISKPKHLARATSCTNYLRQRGIALQAYVDEHQSRYPFYLGPRSSANGDATGTGGTVYWSSQLLPYFPMPWTNKTAHCPGYVGTNEGPQFYAAQGGIERLGSYAYNADGVRSDDRAPGHFGLGPVFYWKGVHSISQTEVIAPSDMVSIGESRFLNVEANQAPGGKDILVCGLGTEPFEPARHGKNYNLLLCDGHVSAMTPFDFFNPTNSASMWNNDHQPHPEFWVP